MIKVYCDKCGKEITGNVNTVVETTEITDVCGAVINKIYSTISLLCDECQYKELTCGFKVGDKVITDDGRVGIIESFCECESCKKRGFYEPRVKMEVGADQIWITDTDRDNGFISFYKIGDHIFGNVDEEAMNRIRQRLNDLRNELSECELQYKTMMTLRAKKLT